mgnify:FL=1
MVLRFSRGRVGSRLFKPDSLGSPAFFFISLVGPSRSGLFCYVVESFALLCGEVMISSEYNYSLFIINYSLFSHSEEP